MESVLQDILINTYNIDGVARKNAEDALEKFLTNPGALVTLINYIGNSNTHRELRQATGIVIKNKLPKFLAAASQREPASPSNASHCEVTDEEKEIFKTRLLDILLVEMDNSIRVILAEAVRIVSESDFPDKWPSLIPTILTCIQSPDVLRMYNALLALRKVAKRYEYKQKEARKPLDDIVQATFPALQQLMTNISNLNSIEAAQVMKMCLKIFWSATMYHLPKVQGVDVNFWFQAIAHILNKPLHEASENIEPLGQPVDVEERPAWAWWKLKKWAARIVSQFIQRYGNPNYASEEYKQFAIFFRENTAAVLLAPVMNTLAARAKGSYVTEDVQRMCIGYVAACVEMSPTYKVLKPHLEFIVTGIIFPTLCLTDADIKMFAEEPVEFVRKVHDPLGDWLSPLIASTNLLQMLARYRQKDALPVVLPYVQNILAEYCSSPPETRDFRKKDGSLVAVAVLAKILNESKAYKHMLVPFLEAHVIPEFQSPVPFLRARACWVIEYFNELDWAQGGGALLQAVLHGLINSLRDPALPVQAAAACSLRLLIEAEGATELLRPMLGDIVSEYFRIMAEVENESVLSALQAIIQNFGEEMAGMAGTMVQHLVTMFGQFLAAGADDEEATFNAVQCLDTIDAVLEAVQDLPDVLAQLEPLIQPMIMKLLVDGEDLFEYIDSAVHMISSFTYYTEGISPHMWSLCGPLLHVLHDWAIDYVGEIMVPILNYLTKDIKMFFQGSYKDEPFVITLLKTIEKIFQSDESDMGKDSSFAATLATCLITSCKDAEGETPSLLHPYLPRILIVTLQRLSQCVAANKHACMGLRVRLLEIVMASLYYDPVASLSVLFPAVVPASPGQTQQEQQQYQQQQLQQIQDSQNLFALLFSTLKEMERTFTQRMIVLSFTAILTMPTPVESLPDILRNNIPSMFQQIIRELVMIEEKGDEDDDDDGDGMDGDDDDEEEEEEEDGDDDGATFDDADSQQAAANRAKKLYVPDGGYDEDQDCLNAEDEAYREALEIMDKEEAVKKQKYAAGQLMDDEDEDEEDFTFTSPVENMDVTEHFLGAMHQLTQRNAQLAAQLQANLDEEDKQRLQGLMQAAQEKKV